MARKPKDPRDPAWLQKIPPYSVAVAIKELAAGTADEGQQKMALAWIVQGACASSEEPFRTEAEGGERETSFILGRQSVARIIEKTVNASGQVMAQLRKSEQSKET